VKPLVPEGEFRTAVNDAIEELQIYEQEMKSLLGHALPAAPPASGSAEVVSRDTP
jgi:hypothetical protein